MRVGKRRKKAGLSELTGTLMMIAVTIVAGVAVFAWANSQAATTENAYGQRVGNEVDYYNEHFVVVSVQFASCSASGGSTYCGQVSASIYNNGNLSLTIKEITISNLTDTSVSNTVVPEMSLVATESALSSSVKCGTASVADQTPYSSSGALPIPVSNTPPTVLTVTLPTACTAQPAAFLVGASYQVQIEGGYGNVVTVEVTAGD